MQNGAQLLDTVLRSLQRYEAILHGETPAVVDLWNNPKNCWTPKEEKLLSNSIKRFLSSDLIERGIMIGREVETQDTIGDTPGEVTDIYIRAAKKNAYKDEYEESIRLIIEVKGCWNTPELKTAMQGQLQERYLKNNHDNYGLYLVCWFMCDQWDDSDYRKGKTPKVSLEEARKIFDEQAKSLSPNGSIKSYVLDARLPGKTILINSTKTRNRKKS